jgi:hypothetical protein
MLFFSSSSPLVARSINFQIIRKMLLDVQERLRQRDELSYSSGSGGGSAGGVGGSTSFATSAGGQRSSLPQVLPGTSAAAATAGAGVGVASGGLRLEMDELAMDFVVAEAYNPVYGARPLKVRRLKLFLVAYFVDLSHF